MTTMKHRDLFDGRTLGEWLDDNLPVLIPPSPDDARWQLVCEYGVHVDPTADDGTIDKMHVHNPMPGWSCCDTTDYFVPDNDKAEQINIIRRAIA